MDLKSAIVTPGKLPRNASSQEDSAAAAAAYVSKTGTSIPKASVVAYTVRPKARIIPGKLSC